MNAAAAAAAAVLERKEFQANFEGTLVKDLAR